MGTLRKTTKPCFSNGSEFAWWEAENCGHCVKATRMKLREKEAYTKCRCAIQRDILTQAMGSGSDEISERSWLACQQAHCPHIKNHYKPRSGRKSSGGYPLFDEIK